MFTGCPRRFSEKASSGWELARQEGHRRGQSATAGAATNSYCIAARWSGVTRGQPALQLAYFHGSTQNGLHGILTVRCAFAVIARCAISRNEPFWQA
jgi:hypothetical protein